MEDVKNELIKELEGSAHWRDELEKKVDVIEIDGFEFEVLVVLKKT